MICVSMLYIDDMCAFHAPYIWRSRKKETKNEKAQERERAEREKLTKKNYIITLTRSKEKNSINITCILHRNRVNATSVYVCTGWWRDEKRKWHEYQV